MKATSAFALATLTAVGCATSDESTATTGSDVVVSVGDQANHVTVKDDRLEFDADLLPQLQPQLDKLDAYIAAADKSHAEPVLFIGNRQSGAKGPDGALKDGLRNPLGYLRRAVSWSKRGDGGIIVETEHATLAEARAEIAAGRVAGIGTRALRIRGAEVTDDAPPDTGGETETWSYAFGGDDGFTPIDLSGTTLWQAQLDGGGDAQVVLTKGSIGIKPTIDAALATSGLVPTSGKAVLTTDVVGVLQIDATVDGQFELSEGSSLYDKKFAGVFGPGLPITLQVDVTWHCDLGIDGKAHAGIGATATGQLVAGAEFTGTSIEPIFPEPSYDLGPIGPTLDANVSVRGDCHLVTTVALEVFDAAGPNATIDLYAKVDVGAMSDDAAVTVDGSMTFGLRATAGGRLDPFGVTLAAIQTDPLTFEQTFSGPLQLGL